MGVNTFAEFPGIREVVEPFGLFLEEYTLNFARHAVILR
jgi:hypothetical protein